MTIARESENLEMALFRECYGHGAEVGKGRVGEDRWASTPLSQRPFLWTGHNPVLPLLPPRLGLQPYSLAFLLFWFNKTKSDSLAGRGGERAARPHPRPQSHHPQIP